MRFGILFGLAAFPFAFVAAGTATRLVVAYLEAWPPTYGQGILQRLIQGIGGGVVFMLTVYVSFGLLAGVVGAIMVLLGKWSASDLRRFMIRFEVTGSDEEF